MPWNTVEGDEKVWMEVVATSGQTFLLFCPLEELADFTFVFLLCSSAFWLSWGRDFYLPFCSPASIQLLCVSCLDPAAALQQQHFGFSAVLPTNHQSRPKGDPHQPSLTCLCHALELSQGETSQDPITHIHRMHLGLQSCGHWHRNCKGTAFSGTSWGWDGPACALEGPVFSEQRTGIRLVFRSC